MKYRCKWCHLATTFSSDPYLFSLCVCVLCKQCLFLFFICVYFYVCFPAGHEYPFAIQTYHNRHRPDFSDKMFQLQFVIKRKEPPQMLSELLFDHEWLHLWQPASLICPYPRGAAVCMGKEKCAVCVDGWSVPNTISSHMRPADVLTHYMCTHIHTHRCLFACLSSPFAICSPL